MDSLRLASNVPIRKMQPHDWPVVRALWIESGLSDEPEDGFEDVVALLSSPQSAAFVVEVNGKIVGAVLCGSDGRYGYIHHLAVSVENRRLRIGQSLVKQCVAFMKCRHVVLMVRETNEIAKGFWRSLGFETVNGLDVLAKCTA